MNNKKLLSPETFGTVKTVRDGIAALAKLTDETMQYAYDLPGLPPRLVIDLYKIHCYATAIDNSTKAKADA